MLWIAEPFTREAERLLRAPGHFQWSTVALLALVVYVYSVEVERRNWSAILAGLAFWLMDWFNELVNALVLHFNGEAALWTVTGSSSFVILIGLTIEISLFFAINGVVYVKLLPSDRRTRILGIPNRWAIAIALSFVSVGVELLLHELGVFHWHYWWWNAASFPVIVVFGYLTFYIVAFVVYDAPSRSRQLAIVGGLALVNLVGALLLGPALGWIRARRDRAPPALARLSDRRQRVGAGCTTSSFAIDPDSGSWLGPGREPRGGRSCPMCFLELAFARRRRIAAICRPSSHPWSSPEEAT